jgi:hypothetical protein
VAAFTCHILVLALQWEVALGVIEGYLLPILRCVAGSAVRPKLSIVLIVGGVTTVASLGSILELPALMTALAGNLVVLSLKREAGLVVIEGDPLPILRGVTGGAVLTELAIMRIFKGVAIVASRRSEL